MSNSNDDMIELDDTMFDILDDLFNKEIILDENPKAE